MALVGKMSSWKIDVGMWKTSGLAMQSYAILRRMAKCFAELSKATLCSAELRFTSRSYAMLCRAAQCSAELHYSTQSYAELRSATQSDAVFRRANLFYALLCIAALYYAE